MSPRTHWYFCPHWERFLARGAQSCLLCDPPHQIIPPQPVLSLPPGAPPTLRDIFPILNDQGDPVPPTESSAAS